MAKKDNQEKYNYVLDWINESIDARSIQTGLSERAINAYQGQPSVNRYHGSMKKYAEMVTKDDPSRGRELDAYIDEIPNKPSWVVQEAVESVVTSAQGGVGRYEFGPYDPQMQKNDRIIDRLNSAALHFYNTQRVDSLMPQLIREAKLKGAGYLHLRKRGDHCDITLMTADQMLMDPKRIKTNYERFRGYTQRESFREFTDRVKKDGAGYFLKTINEAKVYVDQIVSDINGTRDGDLQLPGGMTSFISRDVDMFYKALKGNVAAKQAQDPQYMYEGDEIETAYVYDDMNDMYFEVINRRYIIVAKKRPLTRNVKVEMPSIDSTQGSKSISKKISIKWPIVELPYLKVSWCSYPVTPLFYVLDDFDDLCAMESVLYHNLSIQAPINFVGQASDMESVARATGVSGEMIDALPQTFGVLNKTHDNSPVIGAIQRAESKIKDMLDATDEGQLAMMLGDRASAKEVTAMSGQVSQKLNSFIANIETAAAELGDIFLKMQLILNKDTYSFVHEGRYGELAAEDMAGDYTIVAKLTSSIKMEQEAASRKALELTQYLGGTDKVDSKEFFGNMIPIVLNGLVNREQAKRMIAEQYRAMPEEEIARIKRNAEIEAKKDPIDKLDLSEIDENDYDDLIAEASQISAQQSQFLPEEMAQMAAAQGAVQPEMGMEPVAGDPLAGIPLQGGPTPQGIAQAEVAGEVANEAII